MSKLLLRFIVLFNFFWRKAGADADQLYAILDAKLKMDNRRTSALGSGLRGSGDKKNTSLFLAFANLLMGVFIGIVLIVVADKTTALTLYFSAWMVFLALTIITDFTDVLIDVRDNFILLPKPVSDRTITLSRVLHIFLYLARQVFFFILPAIIMLAFIRPSGIPVFLFQCLIACLMVVFFVNAFYLALLRFTSPDRFKDLINYFQIAFTILIFASYYTLPKLIDLKDVANVDAFSNPLMYGVPSLWVAAIWKVFVEWDVSPIPVFLSMTALIVTVGGAYLVINVLARNLNRKMMALTQGSGAEEVEKEVVSGESGQNRVDRLAQRLTGSAAENAAFQFCWTQISRTRDYKLKTFPSLAFIPILFVYMAIQGEGTVAERLEEIREGPKYLILIYICMLAISAPVMNAMFSDRHRAAWFFRAMPVARPGDLVMGTIKAVFVKYILPVYVFFTLLALVFWGWSVWDDFLYGFIVLLLYVSVVTLLAFDKLPFSTSWSEYNKGNSVAVVLVSMLAIAALGGIHYLLIERPLWMGLVAATAGSAAWAAYRSIVRKEWRRF